MTSASTKVAKSPPVWEIENHVAQFRQDGFAATLTVAQPQEGLGQLRFNGRNQSGRILRVILSADEGQESETVEDVYVRGPDLIATYGETQQRLFRPQVYWRAADAGGPKPAMVAIDLLVSVQTSLLDSRPKMTVLTSLPAESLWYLTNREFEPISCERPQAVELAKGSRLSCVLYRLPESEWSFVAMIHPDDFCRATLVNQEPGVIGIAHELFSRPLEKGVILRARLRGLFLNRTGDMEAARAGFQTLAKSKLPLTT